MNNNVLAIHDSIRIYFISVVEVVWPINLHRNNQKQCNEWCIKSMSRYKYKEKLVILQSIGLIVIKSKETSIAANILVAFNP